MIKKKKGCQQAGVEIAWPLPGGYQAGTCFCKGVIATRKGDAASIFHVSLYLASKIKKQEDAIEVLTCHLRFWNRKGESTVTSMLKSPSWAP